MIIKRWSGAAFVEEHPKTKAQLVFNEGNTESIFDANDKVKPKFLPDAVFDSLNFYSTVFNQDGTNENRLSGLAYEALRNVSNLTADNKRSALGYYWVAARATSLVTTFNFGNLTYDSVQFNTFSSVNAATTFSSSGFFGEQAPAYITTIPSGTASFNAVVGYFNGVNYVYYRQTGNPSGSTWTNIGSGGYTGTFVNGTTYYDIRTAKLYTWTAATGNVGQHTLVAPTGIYIQTKFAGSEYNNQNTANNEFGTPGYSGANSAQLEIGDWVVISKIEGLGTSLTPYIVTFATINNTYELATGSVDGIVRLSTQTTYANLSGSNVVTDGVLKTVIDNAAFAAGNHTHGNITNAGTITSDTAIASGQKLVLVNGSNQVVRSALAIGTSTTTFLTNAGTWATPAGTYAHPTQTAINANATDNGINVIDSVVVDTNGHVTSVGLRNLSEATTSAAGAMSAADKTKLNGIATSANNYTHPAYTTRSIDTDGVEVLDTFTSDAIGSVTNITKRTLPTATTSLPGVMSAADKAKLDGIATGANNYEHPTYTYSTPTADTQTTLSNIQLISTLAQTNGHVTGGTARKLVAGSNVTLTAASDGNITINSSFTNTTYSAKALGGLSLDGTQFQMVHPFFVQADAPTTPLTGTIWFDL
jgi:hypothetical protein